MRGSTILMCLLFSMFENLHSELKRKLQLQSKLMGEDHCTPPGLVGSHLLLYSALPERHKQVYEETKWMRNYVIRTITSNIY